jgi:cytochrome c oxidase subunit 3
MSVDTAHHLEASAHSAGHRLAMNRLGLWLFLISDGFVFGGLLVSRFLLWGNTRPELDQNLGFIVTAILLASSFFMNRGETAMAHGDRKSYILFTTITLLLGAAFLVGVVFVEWPTAAAHGITPDKDVYGAIFYMLTGMHAFHVLTGLIFLGLVLRNARRGLYSAEKHWGVEAAAVYWHFVDLAWIFFYPALYLIGNVVIH